MPDKHTHLKKASHNKNFYLSFNLYDTPFKDWLVAGIFYSALHLIDAYLTTKGVPSLKHKSRLNWMEKLAELSTTVYPDFRELKDFREEATYKCREFTPTEIEKEVIPLLDSIRKTISLLDPSIVI